MKSVCLNAMIAPGPDEPGLEEWAVNGAFRHSKRVTRVYAMDDLSYFPTGWADEINLLPERVRYIAPQHFAEIPRSEQYPIVQIIKHFNGIRFWTSTLAYMLSAAIYEGYGRIVLSGAHWPHDSEEYMSHLPAMNFWTGVAMGKGIKVEIHGPCCIAKPYVWEPECYGFETNGTREVIHVALAAAYKFAAKFPYQPKVHVDVEKMIAEYDKVEALTV